MKFFEVKDIVRQHFSKTAFPSSMLILSLKQGRRLVEQQGNFWWMEKELEFNLVIDQPSYSITTAASGGLDRPNFKDIQALQWKEDAAATRWEPINVGQETKDDLDLFFGINDQGSPEQAAIQDTTLFIYPPKPQVAYVVNMYYWEWTDNPANTVEDDLLNFFPMAIVYASLAWGYELILKDLNGANHWRQLLGGQPFGRGALIAEMRRETNKRAKQHRFTLEPRLGPGRPQRRRLDNLQIYR